MSRVALFNQYIFLLGGHDLEMLEIKKILDEMKLKYLDNNLEWGAKLSSYATVFDKEHIFVGIELIADCAQPAQYIEIDHHNENSHLPSSIERVAEMLGIKLNKWQKLVATNDIGYIPALELAGATETEISKIRKQDRLAQGVTEKDEQLAKQSIEEYKYTIGKVTIVESLTSKFSLITDILYPFGELLIRHGTAFTYYGEKAKIFTKQYKKKIETGRAYTGGKLDTYFGIDTNYFEKDEADIFYKNVLKQIQLMESHSYHIFMFPFRWEIESRKEMSFDERFKLDKLNPKPEKGWINVNKPIAEDKAIEEYNERNYFYKFVHPAIYEKNDNSYEIRHYERIEANKYNLKYEIGIYKDKPYSLDLNEITLDFLSTGTGVLSFYMANTEYPDFEDVKRINHFGRRIFPPFIGKEYGIEETKSYAELADYIQISGLVGDENRYRENFTEFEVTDYWKYAKFIKNLIEDFNPDLNTEPVVDDRMFTMCWFFNNKMANLISNDVLYNDFKKSDVWHEFLYIDPNESTCQNTMMQEELLKGQTYPRWQKKGTLYGITRFSFMVISADEEFPRNVAFVHFRTIYAKMVKLSLFQRASVLKFSAEVSVLSTIDTQDCRKHFEKLDIFYKSYVQFINKIYYREISAQEQAIDLYDMLQLSLRIERQAKELEKEIKELFSYITLLKTNQTNDRMRILTLLAGIFVVPNFILALLNNKYFWPSIPQKFNSYIRIDSILLTTILILSAFTITWGLINLKRNDIWYYKIKLPLILCGILLIVYLLIFQFFVGFTISF